MFGKHPGRLGATGGRTPIQRAIAILRRLGNNANVYLPGVGRLNGLTAGNYIDSAGTTPGAVDQPVGLVLSATSTVNASQATAANRPILRRGALNLLTWSKDFSNAAWAATNISMLPGQADAFGGMTATKVIGTTPNAYHLIARGAASIVGKQTLVSVVKASGFNYAYQGVNNSVCFSIYNLATGELVSGGNPGFVSGSSVSLGNGWWLIATVVTDTAVNSVEFAPIPTNAWGNYAGDASSGVLYCGAALFAGALTAAQIQALGGIPLTTTAPASTALGPYSWDTSGGKSFVATFPAGNESVTVIDARPTGQVTSTAQNVVGSYNASVAIGPELVTTSSLVATPINAGGAAVATVNVGSTTVLAQKTYFVALTVSGYSGTGDLGFPSGTFAAVAGVTRISGNGVISGYSQGGGNPIDVFTRPITNTCTFSNISVREVNPISGKIIVNGALTAPDLLLLQNFANKVAGL